MIGQPGGRARTARRSASSIISRSIVFDSLFTSTIVQASVIFAPSFLRVPEYFANVVWMILPLLTRYRISLVQRAYTLWALFGVPLLFVMQGDRVLYPRGF